MLFTKDFLTLDNGTVIALKFVEGMRYPSENGTLVVSKLKDDLSIDISMISGKDHTISVRRQFTETDSRVKELGISAARDSISEKWCFILTGKTS